MRYCMYRWEELGKIKQAAQIFDLVLIAYAELEKLQADGVLSRQAVFGRCCLNCIFCRRP